MTRKAYANPGMDQLAFKLKNRMESDLETSIRSSDELRFRPSAFLNEKPTIPNTAESLNARRPPAITIGAER